MSMSKHYTLLSCFFFNDTATTEIYTLSLHDALPILLELMDCGLGALPGGGAEVLTPRVHEELYKKKLDWRDWLETARVAHSVGLKSNATMLYGHIETLPEDRKSTRLNSSHANISYAVFCLKK